MPVHHLPLYLRNFASLLRAAFERTRDPAKKTGGKRETQRRGKGGRGSAMIREDRPFPELRPRHEWESLRARFNGAWFREQRAARLAQYRAEKARRTHPHADKKEPVRRLPERGR